MGDRMGAAPDAPSLSPGARRSGKPYHGADGRVRRPIERKKGPAFAEPFVMVLIVITYAAAGASTWWRIFRPISESGLVSAL